MFSAVLALLSATWLAVLTLAPNLQSEPLALALTGTALVINGVTSFVVLIVHKRIPFLLNLLQILLFAMAHGEIYAAGGSDHYHIARSADQFDWQLFAWSHALSAADLVHMLESYWSLNPIQPRSTLARALLVIMHWNFSLFVVSILVRSGGRFWKYLVQTDAQKPSSRPEQLRRAAEWKTRLKTWQLRGLVLALLAFLATALLDNWRPLDWLLWPLDNIVRTVDLGDTLGICRWRLHAVDRTLWTATLAICFRLLVCSYVARWFHALHVRWLGARALRPLEDYIQDLNDDDDAVRAAAAQALGQLGAAARAAVPALAATVDDDAGPVVRIARQALASVGPPPHSVIPELLILLKNPNWAVRREAVQALGQIGPAAQAALPALIACLADKDRTLELLTDQTLHHIDARWPAHPLAKEAVPALLRQLASSDRRLRQRAAESLGRLGASARAAVPDLVARLKDREEYVRISTRWALDQVDPSWRVQVFVVG